MGGDRWAGGGGRQAAGDGSEVRAGFVVGETGHNWSELNVTWRNWAELGGGSGRNWAAELDRSGWNWAVQLGRLGQWNWTELDGTTEAELGGKQTGQHWGELWGAGRRNRAHLDETGCQKSWEHGCQKGWEDHGCH